MGEEVRIAMLGSGFVANFYMEGLKDVAGQEVVLNTDPSLSSAEEFADKWHISYPMDSLDRAINRDDIDLFIIALPNFLHKEVVLKLAEAGRAMVCTKPLGRTEKEAGSMLEAVRDAGVFHGYAETEVFAPAVVRAKKLIETGGLGQVNWFRSREAHSGPHGEWFWDGELSGGGVLQDLGPHCIEAARYFFGKGKKIEEVFARGQNLAHEDKTELEDSAILIMKFEGGGMANIEVSWASRGGLDLRNEVYGTEGSVFTDVTGSTPINAFTRKEANYVLEKGEVDQGWLSPVPEEAFSYGYQGEMKHFVERVKNNEEPRETFEDGYKVNVILDAAYRSMEQQEWQEINY